MRASPRTCPSIRCRRLSADVLASLFIPAILPLPGMGFKRQAIAMMTDISPKASHGENPPNAAHAAASPPVPAGTIYTCPMHPEIRQVGPGSCPICGMALEPEIATADAGPNPELVDMTRRFWIALALSVPIVVLEMGAHVAGAHGWIAQTLSNWIQFALATPVVLWGGWPFFVRGWQSVITRNLNMFTLIAMGTGVAFVYSVVATLAPGVFP